MEPLIAALLVIGIIVVVTSLASGKTARNRRGGAHLDADSGTDTPSFGSGSGDSSPAHLGVHAGGHAGHSHDGGGHGGSSHAGGGDSGGHADSGGSGDSGGGDSGGGGDGGGGGD